MNVRVARLGLALLVAGATAMGGAALLSRSWPLQASSPSPTRGAELFSTTFKPEQGLGPLFNETSCVSCHNSPSAGGSGAEGLSTVLRVGQLTTGQFDPMIGKGGPVARAHSIAELGVNCPLAPGIPAGANVTSVRNTPPLFGDGLINAIPDAVISAGAVARGGGIQGRPNFVDRRVGRFGWKADTPSLEQFVGEAFRNELGLTNPIAPLDLVPPGVCGGGQSSPKIDAGAVSDVVAYIDSLPAPQPGGGDSTVFDRIGCGACHVSNLGGVPLYSDLLLHNMGSALDDGVIQASAAGQDWRTTPLWGLSRRVRFLHDGRARSLDAAIKAHAGEAAAVVERYQSLTAEERTGLLLFLATL